MSNTIYRPLMRWVYRTLYPLLFPLLHPRQFGGRQGTSEAHATQTFLHDIDHLDNVEAILAFDVYHAFDSPPKALISLALQRFGTPLRLLRLISLALEYGATYIRGCPESVFRTTHRVKQGCPLSCFLFFIVFEIPLRYLHVRGLPFSAYVDDISSPALRGRSQHGSTTVQEALALIGCQLDIIKSEALPVARPPPAPPALPKCHHPSSPVQASTGSPWISQPCADLPSWADTQVYRFTAAKHLMHLGHLIPAYLNLNDAFCLVRNELKAQLDELHEHPIQTLDRVHLVNTMVVPRLLFRTECLPLSVPQLQGLSALTERFVLGVTGLPPLVAKKTLYTHRRHGPGLSHVPTPHPTRVLDSLHRNFRLQDFDTSARRPFTPYGMFLSAITTLGSPTGDSPTPLPIIWDPPKIYRQATSVVTVAVLRVYIVPSPHRPDAVPTDGSKLGDPPTSGAAAVLRDGSVAVCRVPGAPDSYKAELVGILLRSHFGDHGDRLRLDCLGAILSSSGHKRPVRQAHWVQLVRASLRSKEQDLDWVEGHTGQQFNEASDHYAKLGTTPPPPQRFALPPGISSGKVNTSCPPQSVVP